tara:strand:- start:4512 stop:4868 length:357 start_codon:yes stop_codon:yes gene_type:complete
LGVKQINFNNEIKVNLMVKIEEKAINLPEVIKSAVEVFLSLPETQGVTNLHDMVLDVSFREDESRVRRDNAPENFGVFRHVAMNALRKEKTCKKGVKAKRFKATLQAEYAQQVVDGVF